jgi:beta-glucosidase
LNRTGVNAKPDERTLREVYLPAFEASVKESNVLGMMGAYNEYNGTNANQSAHLINTILKGEWGFQGVLLTDWNVDINTYDAAMNGLDLEMGTDVPSYDDYFLARPFLEAIKAGDIPESVLDDKVRRMLRVQYSIGMYDENRLEGERNTKKHQDAAKHIAAQGVVLLKNENINNKSILPLNKKEIKNVLVLGPNADTKHGTGGGSSEVKSLYEVTPLQGLREYLGDDVNIQVMRARSSELAPIAGDYLTSRHWTGTVAWNISFFEDAAREKLLSESWIVDSQYTSKQSDSSKADHITMTARLKPLESGEHELLAGVVGDFSLKIDGNTVLEASADKYKIVKHTIDLSADKEYTFEINYDGNDNFTLGWNAPGNLFTPEEEYLAAAKAADAVIYFGGLSHADDRESIDRPHMKLPNSQDYIINKLLDANKETIVFLVAGSAVEMPWADKANAIVWGWYGGQEAGHAFSEVLFGDINPSGKMPISLPAKLEDTAPIALDDYNAVESLYKEGVFIGHRWFEQQNIEPTFAFGYGLSYTNFSMSDIKLSSNEFNGKGTVTIEAKVTNTGDVAGAEVVQLYLSDKEASVPRPAKELKDFDKIYLEPGESGIVQMQLSLRDLSFWDIKSNNWLAEAGEFEVLLGNSSNNISLQKGFTYKP